MPTALLARCPCGAALAYEGCCGPLHRGEREASTAAALMRSRYSAFARGDVEYLVRTLHPDHADREDGDVALRRSLRETLRRYRYAGLRVLDARDAGADGLAQVLFEARVFEGRADRSFVERSYFAHDGSGWRYLAGDLLPTRSDAVSPGGMTIETFERVRAGSAR